jgi:hypothetical protein
MTDFEALLRSLVQGGVEFVLVGGVAATIHGSVRLTTDVDVVYGRSAENLARLATALAPFSPYPRGAPPGLPFLWDTRTLSRGLNFTLRTTLGDLDLLGEIAGGGRFEDLRGRTSVVRVFGVECLVLDLPTLISVKRAAGRPKDFEAVAELEAILEESAGRTGP